MTVQVAEAPDPIEVGEQVKPLSSTAGCKVSPALRELVPMVAVTVADCEEVTLPAVAIKVPVLAPAAIVTEVGVVSRLLLSDSVTAVRR